MQRSARNGRRLMMVAALAAMTLTGAAASASAVTTSTMTTPATSPQGSISRLLAHLPDRANPVLFVDLDRARQVLGLPADSAFFSGTMPAASPKSLLMDTTGSGIPDLEEPMRPPLVRVLVQSDVSAAATSVSPVGAGTVIATSQSRSSLLSKLAAAGYRRRAQGTWLSPASSSPLVHPEYLALYPGGIVESARPAAAAAMAAQTTTPASDRTAAAQLLAAGPAPAVGVSVVGSGCVSAITISDRLSPRTGEIRVLTRTAPTPSRLFRGHLVPGDRLSPVIGRPKASGHAVVARLTLAHGNKYEIPPYPDEFKELLGNFVYRCG